MNVIDLRSDTVTQPSPAMRRAMAEAEVGDDVLDGDPTTRRLEERIATVLGSDDALFFPSGTQANQTGIIVMLDLVRDGDTSDTGAPRLAQAGVRLVPFGARRLRAVTHLDVNRTDVERAAQIIVETLR
jgi:threonine aldolase